MQFKWGWTIHLLAIVKIVLSLMGNNEIDLLKSNAFIDLTGASSTHFNMCTFKVGL